MLKVDILTAFPNMFAGPFDESIVKRAQDKSLVKIDIYDLRKWADDKYKSIDDRPYGGGPGMILRIDIIDRALADLRPGKIILLDASGKTYNQRLARDLSHEEHLILICGHYEGVDHRVHEHLADEVISVGDYVLSGGEIPAMTIVDSVVRLLPGTLGNETSLKEESHNKEGKVEYPQFTRPEEYRGWRVPKILLGGDHAKIVAWRRSQFVGGE